jgi:CelD/BcsL family acetyltransferase involved in cellulose biosynthesis
MSDLVLASAGISLYRRSASLDEEPLGVDDLPPPPPLDDAAGYVVFSQPIAQVRPALTLRRNVAVYTPRQYHRYSAELGGDFDEYMSHFSGKTRSTLKRKLRKFAEASGGSVDWQEYRTADQIAEFFPLAHRVSKKTYQERLLRAGLPSSPAFFTKALELARQDRVRGYLLFLERKPVSYLYCPVQEGIVVYDHLGYDPAYGSLSPGTVLQLLALQALFAERRFILFDFTEGEGQHKEMFATRRLLCGDVFVISRRLRPLSVVMLHRAVDKTSMAAGRVLDRWALKSRVRRLLRR